MRLATGKVVGGKVVLDSESFAEGDVVTVLASENDETFLVSPDQEAALLAAIADVERGDTISPEQLFERLRRFA
jgi:hypothetical protein